MKANNLILVFFITIIRMSATAQQADTATAHKHELMFNVYPMFKILNGSSFSDSHMSVIYRKLGNKFNYRFGLHLASSTHPYDVNKAFVSGNDTSAVVRSLQHYPNKFVSPGLSFGMEKRENYNKVDFYYGADLYVIHRIGAYELRDNTYCINGDCGIGASQYNQLVLKKRAESYDIGVNVFFGLTYHINKSFALFIESSSNAFTEVGSTYIADNNWQNLTKVNKSSNFNFNHLFIGKVGFVYNF